MQNTKLLAGKTFPTIELTNATGATANLVTDSDRWSLIVVYRGYHCPICLKYLNKLEDYTEKLDSLNIDVVAASADTPEQLIKMQEKGLEVSFPVLTGLTLDHMKTLGLYISDPMSDSETDHAFAEPGLFLVNPEGKTVMIEIANAPFIRPDLEQLVSGIEFVFEKDYPIRGTHQY
ncbi:redoxin domain-containing protein [Aliiglaciecola lipolytica]|uniref:Thioredoxin peroxidase n=1 Tax=Aliiglaciecola lipolytica E3 TaxID=1127673 RepID=K6XMF4_9ALTE|nr:redoxin domain-containing protein [Aliiglaciecola lipolytica]GAC12836.1 thioredoxin peroxidase [Aliiglaciecola lipolytica E3]